MLTFHAHRYHAEPSGTFYRYDAKAIGSGSEGAQAELQNEFHKSLTLPEAELLVRHYLQDMPEVDTLILGCTHYPLLRHAFANVLGPGVTLVDSAETVAEAVSLQMVNGNATAPGRVSHLVTGDPAAFAHTARLMGAREEELVRVDRALLDNTMSTAPGRPRLGDEPSPGPQQ